MAGMSRREAVRGIGSLVAGLAAAGAVPLDASRRGLGVAEMATRRIPSSGEEVPVMGMGTWQTFDVGSDKEARANLREVLRAFVALGGRVVDSSPMYGSSEEVLGDLARETGLHPRLWVATKVWTRGRREGIEQMEDSMRKLRVERVDLMQVHNLVDVETHLETLREWKAAGRVRYVGVTHYTAASHEQVARVLEAHPLDFVQINYSVGEREAERRLLPLARERGVAVIANRPFAGGGLFRRLRGRPLPSYAAAIGCRSWAQLLLKWVVSHPALTCAIPATSNPAHLRDNMLAGHGRMPDEALRRRIAAEVA